MRRDDTNGSRKRGEERDRERKEGKCGAVVWAQGRKVRRRRKGRIITAHISVGGCFPPASQTYPGTRLKLLKHKKGDIWLSKSHCTLINFMATVALLGWSASCPLP